jgi:hypothetical protein
MAIVVIKNKNRARRRNRGNNGYGNEGYSFHRASLERWKVNKIRQHPHAPLIYSDKGHAAKGAQPIPLPKWQHSPGVTGLNDLPTEYDATSLGQRQ